MERRRNASSPDEQYQQQQAHATFENHLNQQQQPPPQLVSEPNRRRNAPIDIDTALRLQAQANLVQEPASAASSAASSARSRCELESVGLTQQAAAATSAGVVLGQRQREQSGTPRSSDSTSQTATTPTNNNCQASHFYDHLYISKTSRPSGDHNNNNNNLNSTSNTLNFISVDYIDCLSNNDLLASPPTASVSATAADATMRCIPCRKHLSRFQRGHRVEPRPQDGQPQELSKEQQQAGLNQADSSGDSNSLVAASNMTNTSADSSSLLLASGSLDGGDLMDQQQRRPRPRPHANSESVLYPIPISEAKKRTYFIGSVSQDSLLSHDELHRYFPNGRISIFACTWNQNRKRAPINLDDLLLPERLVYMPDIYAIGIQEAYSSQQDYLREWEIELQTTLGPNHVMLHSCALGALHLALFIRRDLIWFCSTPEESLYNSRSMPTNMIKTKGATSIAFRFFGTSFMFTNCHFPAHENKIKDRIDEYQRIRNSIDLPKNLKLLKPRYLSNDSTARFDCVFFMGDLNFRLEQRTFDETIQILEDIFQSKEPTFEALTQNDELLKVMESQQAFHGFDEAQIKFPPTYKFLAQTNKYDRQTKRVPSYTDRILFRSKRQRHIQCLIYDWLPQLISSDHKPVYGLFDVLIRPGHERNMVSSLNAGLFHRAVYIEALKRRAEDSDGLRENGVGGNLICSIS